MNKKIKWAKKKKWLESEEKRIKWTKKMEPDKFPEIEVKPRYAPCKKCGKPVDMSKIYTLAYPDGEEQILHIECFHQDYTPDEDEPRA